MKKAFTLIELLVVVLIIGILSAIALPQYQAAVEKSRSAEIWTMLHHADQVWELQYLTDPENAETVKPQDVLDLTGGVWNAAGNKYCTKNFIYSFYSNQTTISRCTPKADCSGCEGSVIYEMWVRNKHHVDYGDNQCDTRNDVGLKVCNSFVGIIPMLVVDDR